jgi:phosphoglucosamine mutase
MTKEHCKKIFGTDGVRGKANSSPMTPEIALALGRATGRLLRSKKEMSKVVIGKDTRLSCYMFENALIAGLCSMGVHTLMVGPFPTPAVAFITRAYRADAGIVISASHNPYYDNGIKFFSSEGYKMSDNWEREIERLVFENSFTEHLPLDHEIGRNTKVHDANGRYIEFAKATFPKKLSLRGMKIAVDCANGASYRVAPLVFEELDAEVFAYGVFPNGLNINQNCGSLFPENVQKAVIEHKADIGISFDGDADRVVLVDETAQIVDGDVIVAICAMDMLSKGLLNNNRVVMTIMSNCGVIKNLEDAGIEVIRSEVGDRHVIKEMLKHNATLGGEQSGHIITLEHNTTGDGLVSALQILGIMREKGMTLSELSSQFMRYPQTNLSTKVSSKPPLENLKELQKEIEEVKKALGSEGQVIVRYSGTENLCRVMVEGRHARDVSKMANAIIKKIKEELGEL